MHAHRYVYVHVHPHIILSPELITLSLQLGYFLLL